MKIFEVVFHFHLSFLEKLRSYFILKIKLRVSSILEIKLRCLPFSKYLRLYFIYEKPKLGIVRPQTTDTNFFFRAWGYTNVFFLQSLVWSWLMSLDGRLPQQWTISTRHHPTTRVSNIVIRNKYWILWSNEQSIQNQSKLG